MFSTRFDLTLKAEAIRLPRLSAAEPVERLVAVASDPATDADLWRRWDELADSGASTVFQTSAFLRPMFEILAPTIDARPLVVEVFDRRHRPVLSLALTRSQQHGIRTIAFADLGFADLAAPVFDPAAVGATSGEALRRAIVRALPAYDVLALSKMPATVGGHPNPLVAWDGVRPSSQVTMACDLGAVAVADLPAVKECDRKFRKIAREGGAVRLVTDAERAVTVLAEIERLRALRHDQDGADNSLAPAPVRAFYAAVVTRALATGTLALYEVVLGERVIAAVVGFRHHGHFHGTLMGVDIDDTTKAYSPGALAVTAALRDHAAAGGRLFDLGMGENPYKARFGGSPQPLYDYRAFRSLRGLAPVIAARAVDGARAYVRTHPLIRAGVARLRGRAA